MIRGATVDMEKHGTVRSFAMLAGLSGLRTASCSSASDGASSQAASDSHFPCDVAAILEQHCFQCHGEDLVAGAVPLTHPSDLRAYSSLVAQRLHDAENPMPPPSG